MLRAVLLVLLLSSSGVAALSVAPDEVSSSDGTLLVRWDDEAGRLWLQADRVGGVLSDSIMTDRPDLRGTALAPLRNATGTRDTQDDPLPGGADRVWLSDGSPTILVHPLSPAFRARITGAPQVELESVDDELLEYNHAYRADETEPAEDHYEFRVRDVVAAHAAGSVGVLVEGDFLLYVWGATLYQDGEGGAHVHRTGTWTEPGSAPGLADTHYRHALLLVRDGRLRIDAPAGASLYGPELVLTQPDGGLLHNGDPVPLTATRDGDSVALDTAPAGSVAGAVGSGPVGVAPVVAPAVWGVLAAVVLAALWLAPSLRGSVESPPGTPFWLHFRAVRADGFRRLAVAAEARRGYVLAAFWMGRAVAWGDGAEGLMQHAIYLRMAGDHGRALARHRDAEEAFRAEGVVHALNAYEAARAAACVGRFQESLRWLMVAVREEPWLARKAPLEPDLAPLRSLPVLPAFLGSAWAADSGLVRP